MPRRKRKRNRLRRIPAPLPAPPPAPHRWWEAFRYRQFWGWFAGIVLAVVGIILWLPFYAVNIHIDIAASSNNPLMPVPASFTVTNRGASNAYAAEFICFYIKINVAPAIISARGPFGAKPADPFPFLVVHNLTNHGTQSRRLHASPQLSHPAQEPLQGAHNTPQSVSGKDLNPPCRPSIPWSAPCR